MEGNLKQVKVDNWGVFFLQRLQQLYAKGEYCDLTLLFTNNERVKVHRLVLNACTEYFKLLEKLPGQASGAYLHMPANMHPDVVLPIINFMYTGRLEFRMDVAEELYTTAQHMNMMVLTKLLDVQSRAPSPAPAPAPAPAPRRPESSGGHHFVPPPRKTVLARAPDADLSGSLPGRRLPIWKKRNMNLQGSAIIDGSSSQFVGYEKRKSQKPRPTRFEWPENGVMQPVVPFTSSFDDLSYETAPILKAPGSHKHSDNSFSAIPSTQSQATTFEEIQRSASNSVKRPIGTTSFNEKHSNKTRVLDLQAVKEYVQEHQLRKDLLNTEEDGEDVDDDLAVADLDDDEDDEEDMRNGATDSISEEPDMPTNSENPVLAVMPQKSILKVPVSNEETISPSKKVRFSIDAASAEKENNVEEGSAVPEVELHDTLTSEQEQEPTSRSVSTPMTTLTNSGNISNHARIITEVLKKYPNLVKKNKNIKLKIMHRGPAPNSTKSLDGDGNKSVMSKVSYVMLKSDVALAASKAKIGVKLDEVLPQAKVLSGAENTTGPWLCYTCGTQEEPMNFETYYLYRRHLQDVHMEKIDARICEHCGHRASKRNLLLYHLYTKHDVPPPRNCTFPSCDQCDYVALSESLLIKHRNSHLKTPEFVCKVCKASFKSNGALQGHMHTNLHSVINKKLHECQFCQKPFVRSVNLKAHIRACHKEEKMERSKQTNALEFMGDESLTEDEGEIVDVPVMDASDSTESGHALPPGVTLLAEGPNVLSSEAEALSNVASGIAASLGLAETVQNDQTVIVLDDNQEYILNHDVMSSGDISEVRQFVENHTEAMNDEVTETEVQEYVEETAGAPLRPDTQEFIVPDIMSSDEHAYQSAVSYEDSCGQAIVTQSYSTPSNQAIASGEYDPSRAIIVSQAYDVSDSQGLTRHESEGGPVTIPPPLNMPSGEVTMILSDHDYVEDAVPREGMMIYITHPGDVDMGMIQQMTGGKGAQLLLASQPGDEVNQGQLVQLEGGTIVRVIGPDEATALQQSFVQAGPGDGHDSTAGDAPPPNQDPRPMVQMSELVKDWEDFDDSEESQGADDTNTGSQVKTEQITTQLVKFLPENLQHM
ncbi:centrosome-associated zinc finger protein Cp190 [Bacillus rossius redtenbacheri]|uniref:centrosome-associated zinc finger protein Cp190 n=1 Tax=Bacillus rossius redtenbacheri TaxID=93214 RepID=UPI002FDD0AF5